TTICLVPDYTQPVTHINIDTHHLHDALPILKKMLTKKADHLPAEPQPEFITIKEACEILQVSAVTLWRYEKQGKIKVYGIGGRRDRKSTRLNSSHVSISYVVYCFNKKKRYIK